MDEQLEDMIHDVGEDYFKRARVYDTLCKYKEEMLYPECTTFTQLLAVLRLFSTIKSGWTDKNLTELFEFLKDIIP